MNKKAELISSDVTEIVRIVETVKEEINNLLFYLDYQLTYEIAYDPSRPIDGFGIAFLIKGNRDILNSAMSVLENQTSLMQINFEMPSVSNGPKMIGLTEFNGTDDFEDYENSDFIILGFEFV